MQSLGTKGQGAVPKGRLSGVPSSSLLLLPLVRQHGGMQELHRDACSHGARIAPACTRL